MITDTGMRKIAFIGVGNMAEAIIKAAIRHGLTDHANLVLYRRQTDLLAPYAALGAKIAASAVEAAESADCVILAVKPQNFPDVLPALSQTNGIQSKLIVSIAAGISTETIRSALGGAPVVRVLPNTPMLIGLGVSVVCRTADVCDDDFSFVCRLFEAAGRVLIVHESDMDRMVSVTSSAPAYVFTLIQAIMDGAREQGIDTAFLPYTLRDTVCDSVIGAANLVKANGNTLTEYIQAVSTEGGTTERAMTVLAERDLNAIIRDAMQACTDRAEELGGGAGV